jgi:membrane-associated phospholipid phosphatase
LALIIASTRVIIGAHFISDIFGGVLVAYLCTIFVRNKFSKNNKLFNFKENYYLSKDEVNQIFENLDKIFQNIFSLYLSFNFYFKTLTVTLILSIVFFLFQNLDITVSGLFFGQDGSFIASEEDWFIYLIRKMIMPLLALLIFFIPLAAIVKQIKFKEKILDIPVRDWTYLFTCLILGTGVVVNSIFKNLWGRARPNDTIQFGGEEPFTIPWLNVNYCETNCSFVSGDVSFVTLSLAVLIIFNKTTWNTFAYIAIGLMSLLRIMEGGHFFSDTIMSFIITFVMIRVLYVIFQRFPEDLNLNKLKLPILHKHFKLFGKKSNSE